MEYSNFLSAGVNLAFSIFFGLGEKSVGEIIYDAMKVTFEETGVNVNLGITLLIVPLAQAKWVSEGKPLRESLRRVLRDLSVEDARWVYKTIRMISPGGLGKSSVGDVREEPKMTLLSAMKIASKWDSIAFEYSTDYKRTFEFVYPRLLKYRKNLKWELAIVQVFLELLAEVPDTLIARKYGNEVALSVSERAREILQLGGIMTEKGREALAEFDRELREGPKKLNPGATADLIASGIMVYLLEAFETSKGGIAI